MGEKLIFLQNFVQRTCEANCWLQLCRKQVNAISKTERDICQKLMTPFFVGGTGFQKLWGPKKKSGANLAKPFGGFTQGW